MNPARFSVQRPVFTSMVSLIVVILGGISLSRLPVDLMPDISYPTLSVSTSYENASPEEVEELITRPVEEAMSAVPGVEDVSSVSGEGSSNVRVTFTWGTDLDAAANDIRDRLDRVIPRLPEDATRPALRKFDPAAFPILIMGAAGQLDPIEMRRLIENDIKHRIERVPGVASLDVWGGLDREIHVDIEPDKLRMLGLSLDQIVQRIRAANVTLPAGSIEEGLSEITVRAPGEFRSLDELRDTTVALRAGAPVRLRDVAEVSDRWERVRRIVRVNGLPGVRVSINKQSGVNTVEVARNALAEIERINRDIPQIRITPIIDTSEYIQRSIASVRSAALYGGLFALAIVLFFLRNIRSTAIIGTAIPLSIVATFVIIYFGGFTLNLMTLGGLALGVGMLVDNSIVSLESIYRRRKAGLDAREAAIQGAGEVSGAIVASTMTTLAVFLPLIFVRGMAGIMFRQLAYVVSFALLCSLAASLTLIPMLASKFLRISRLGPGSSPANANSDKSVDLDWTVRMENGYKRLLDAALAHRIPVALGCVALLGGSLFLIPLIGTELMPAADEGEIRLNIDMEVGTRLTETDRVMSRMEKIIVGEIPELRNMVASIGGAHWRAGGSHTGNMRVSLAPRSQRTRSSEEIAAALRPKFRGIPGAAIRVRAGQGLFLISRMTGTGERVEIEIRGYDLDISNELAQRVLGVVEQTEGVTDAQVSREIGTPERLVYVDRAKAEAMNVTVRQVADLLQTTLTGAGAGFYRDGGDEVAIRVKLKDAEQRPWREILDLTVTRPDGSAVSLRNIVATEAGTGPALIERRNQERIATVRANIADRAMSDIMKDIRVQLEQIPVPRGFAIVYGGDYEEQQEAFGELAVGLALALVLVYMVMACLYESLRDPFIVMFSVPLAIIGVILMLFLTGTTFNIQSYIGCIMLGGIVVNNAILLVDTANALRKGEGLTLIDAVAEAGRRRLRPILMTALTTIFGLLPLALGLGEGGEAQAPMARAVIGGLFSSTLVTLVFVPIVYTFFEKNGRQTVTGTAL